MKNKAFEKICRTDGMVAAARLRGISLEEIVVILCEQKRILAERIKFLESIAPKKVVVGGKVFVWHCPDDLIPEAAEEMTK